MKKIKNKKLEKILATIIELLEFTLASAIGVLVFKATINNVVIVLLTFFISRFAIGSPRTLQNSKLF